MSLRTADSLSNGFENPLESHLHGVDGFFREHTTLPASEYNALQGGIVRFMTKAGQTSLRYLRFMLAPVNLVVSLLGELP